MGRPFAIVDVFTAQPFGGNQLAVVTDAAGMGTAEMQAVAAEFGFAETSFVLPPAGGGVPAVRIFTPAAELPFAGHPTCGTAAVLAHLGRLPDGSPAALEEAVGPVQVRAEATGAGRWRAALELRPALDLPAERPDPDRVAAACGLAAGEVEEAWYAGVGVRFCLASVADPATVDRARPDPAAWAAGVAGGWAEQVHLHAAAGAGRVHARMFAPALGIPEDPATGSAALALVASLAARSGADLELVVDQGVAMGRPSRIEAWARWDGTSVSAAGVGGGVALVATGELHAP